MNMYIVRLKENKCLVGFYYADDTEILFDLVDELCDPFECEFVECDLACGMYWMRNVPVPCQDSRLNSDNDDETNVALEEYEEKLKSLGFPAMTEELECLVAGLGDHGYKWEEFTKQDSFIYRD